MRKSFLFISATLVFACGSSTVKHSAILPEADMVTLLIDIHLLEAKIGVLSLERDSSLMLYNTLEIDIFKKCGTDSSFYEKSYQHYLADPKKLDEIYAQVIDSLNFYEKRGYVVAP